MIVIAVKWLSIVRCKNISSTWIPLALGWVAWKIATMEDTPLMMVSLKGIRIPCWAYRHIAAKSHFDECRMMTLVDAGIVDDSLWHHSKLQTKNYFTTRRLIFEVVMWQIIWMYSYTFNVRFNLALMKTVYVLNFKIERIVNYGSLCRASQHSG